MNRFISLAIFYFSAVYILHSQVSSALKIMDEIRDPWEHFGNSVAIDGPYAVVGVCNMYSTDKGSAVIFERDAGGNWNKIQRLEPSDLQPGDLFGTYTAMSGNYMVVSAPTADSVGLDSTITSAGAVYIFERGSNGVWEQVFKIWAPDAQHYDRFGWQVGLSGKYLVLGSYNNYDANGMNYKSGAGAAYVYERTDGGEWLPVQKLTASDRSDGDWFTQVAVDSYTKTIVVGAPRSSKNASGANTIQSAGSIYVFKRDGSGNWNETQKLTASVRHQQAYFGTSVDVNGSWILVGASDEHYNDNEVHNPNKEGAAYLFEVNGAGLWTQKRKIGNPDGYDNDDFGRTVSLDGNYALIGSAGGLDENGGNFFFEAGCAYLYERNGAIWSLKKKLIAPDRTYHDEFTYSIAISGEQIIIGAPQEAQEEVVGYNKEYGAAYIFTILNPLEMEENELFSVNAYPNPTDGNLTISGERLFTELELMDVTGKVLDKTSLSPSGMISYSINQPEGIYFLKITAGKSSVVKKILLN
ncbi:T9SS type A sorting domain-containing protein [Fluviicola taffensis]|nr:T9SS type A sorting domain-containing protein [Fluviicola taffensis]